MRKKYRVKRHTVTQPLDESYRFIPLTKSKIAIVDASDFEWLNQWNWCACFRSRSYYAVRRIDGKTVGMHSVILGTREGEEVDHENHNTLDNRRDNIRKCTHRQNMQNLRKPRTNTSGFKGVSKHGKKWAACISVNDKTIHIGWYKTKIEAALAYDEAARKYRGEFVDTNFSKAAH